MRKSGLLLPSMALALLLVSGVAWAVTKVGGPGDDTLVGTDGRDRLKGEDGGDVLIGKGGDDGPDTTCRERSWRLVGGGGDDTIDAGGGTDLVKGAGLAKIPSTSGPVTTATSRV
jgi:hypothetical protein